MPTPAPPAPVPEPSSLSRSILVPFDALADTAAAQQLAIMFDRIFVWQLNRRLLSADESRRVHDDLAFLRSHTVAGLMVPSIPIAFGTDDNGQPLTPARMLGADIEVPIHLAIADSGLGAGLGPTDSVLRNVASSLWWNYAPVSAQIESGFPAVPHGQTTTGVVGGTGVRILVKNVPLLPSEIPWKDVLEFRADAENRQHLRLLRLWLQKQTASQPLQQGIEEELESLLYDYRKYMAIQHKKYRGGTLATVISGVGNAITQAAAGQFMGAASAIVDIWQQSMALSEAELGAPGREVSYIIRAEDFAKKHSGG